MKLTSRDLGELAMWEDWQEIVRRSLPNFCASPIYVQQRSQSQLDFELAAEFVSKMDLRDVSGKLRDVEFGGLARDTKACGRVTRMWLDSQVETDFLIRHGMEKSHVLDIGAGYGRLAVPLSEWMRTVTCVDAVPISTEICRRYTQRFAPSVRVLSLEAFLMEQFTLPYDLAINIHSWNECSLPQIERWLAILFDRRIPYLFTVSNGHLQGGRSAYSSWGGKGESFRPLLEAQYHLRVEESIGLSYHPHALWTLK